MKPNRAALNKLMENRKLKCKAVAIILGVKSQTVSVWRCGTGVDIPTIKLKYLRLKTGEIK